MDIQQGGTVVNYLYQLIDEDKVDVKKKEFEKFLG